MQEPYLLYLLLLLLDKHTATLTIASTCSSWQYSMDQRLGVHMQAPSMVTATGSFFSRSGWRTLLWLQQVCIEVQPIIDVFCCYGR